MIQKGVRFFKSLVAHNKDFVTGYLKRSKGITQQNFFEVYADIHNKTAPVFVLSTGRCGTALLTEIFAADNNIDVNHNNPPIMLHHSTVAHKLHNSQPEMLKQVIDACRTEMLIDTYLKGNRYIETNPYVTFFAYQLYELFPKSRFLHIIRHPGDFVRSTVSLNWYSGHRRYDMARIKPENEENFNAWSNIRKAAWTWNEYNVFIDRFITSVDPQRTLVATSESLFKKEGSLKDILAFSGAVVSTQKLEKILKAPVNASKPLLPAYNNWDEAMKDELRISVDQKLCNKFGYAL